MDNESTGSGFHVGALLTDTDGNRVRAHQPHIFAHNGTYYMFGAARVGMHSDGAPGVIHVYESTDLYQWRFGGVALDTHSERVARPSMLGRNPLTNQFVLWVKGAGLGRCAVAATPRGPFVQQHPCGEEPGRDQIHDTALGAGDMQAYRDPRSDRAFLFYASSSTEQSNEWYLMVLELDAQWTGLKGTPPYRCAGWREAPAPFYSSLTGHNYLWTSGTSGWDANEATVYRRSAGEDLGMPRGGVYETGHPWWDGELPFNTGFGGWSGLALLENPCCVADAQQGPQPLDTFDSQGSHVLPLGVRDDATGAERFLYMGDRYEHFIDTVEGGRYVFLPLEVLVDGTVVLFLVERWSLHQWPSVATAGARALISNAAPIVKSRPFPTAARPRHSRARLVGCPCRAPHDVCGINPRGSAIAVLVARSITPAHLATLDDQPDDGLRRVFSRRRVPVDGLLGMSKLTQSREGRLGPRRWQSRLLLLLRAGHSATAITACATHAVHAAGAAHSARDATTTPVAPSALLATAHTCSKPAARGRRLAKGRATCVAAVAATAVRVGCPHRGDAAFVAAAMWPGALAQSREQEAH